MQQEVRVLLRDLSRMEKWVSPKSWEKRSGLTYDHPVAFTESESTQSHRF